MKKDEPGKTRKFIRKGIVLWILSIVIFILLQLFVHIFGDVNLASSNSGFFSELSGIVLMVGGCFVPIILFFAAALKVAEKMIDKKMDKNEK